MSEAPPKSQAQTHNRLLHRQEAQVSLQALAIARTFICSLQPFANMSISSMSSSPSITTMPPRHVKKLAEAMDEAFKTNSKPMDDGEDEKSEHGGPPEEAQEEEPVIEQPQGYTVRSRQSSLTAVDCDQMSSVYPPQPCDRCVRSKKTCKGIAGARCEHCKSLHQKCSNSTGPPRGRHAGKFVYSSPTLLDQLAFS